MHQGLLEGAAGCFSSCSEGICGCSKLQEVLGCEGVDEFTVAAGPCGWGPYTGAVDEGEGLYAALRTAGGTVDG